MKEKPTIDEPILEESVDVLTSAVVEQKPKKQKTTLSDLFSLINKRTAIVTVVSIVAVVAIIVGVGFAFQHAENKRLAKEAEKDPKIGSTYYLSDQETPTASETEVTAMITMAYYTNDGHMGVHLSFANSMPQSQHLNWVQVEIRNAENKVIATGYSDNIEDNYVIPTLGNATLLLYISPEYIEIADDPLETISYTIKLDYKPVT